MLIMNLTNEANFTLHLVSKLSTTESLLQFENKSSSLKLRIYYIIKKVHYYFGMVNIN